MNENYESISLASYNEVLDDNNEFLLKVLNEVNRWSDNELEFSQSRSDFQIEKFIVQDSYTIPSAFKIALINRKSVAEDLLAKVVDMKRYAREFHYKWDGKDKSQPILWKNREGGQDLCWYDLDEFQFNISIDGITKSFKALVQELNFFDKMLDRLIELNGGKPITLEQYNEDQPNYWLRRLSDQSLDDILSSKTGVNPGNIRSMRRASDPTLLENDLNRVKGSFGDIMNSQDFLKLLQENADIGVEEMVGANKKIKQSAEEVYPANIKEKNPNISLFNKDLKEKTPNISLFNKDLKK